MQHYIQQLIEDFNRAEANPISEPDFGDSYEEFEKTMLEIEEGKTEDPKQQLGVSYEELPPADRMSIAQTQELTIAMLNALNAKGTQVHFPGEGIPVKLAYTEVRKLFKEGFNSMPGWTIDFCSGWCPDCAFADYCKTKDDIWSKEDFEKERNNNNLVH